MEKSKLPAMDVDDYIARYPKEIQQRLQQIRGIIKTVVPAAEETIKYAIPTFVLHGNMISFAAFKNHLGIYPAPAGSLSFQKELAPYLKGKSTIQFSFERPLPLKLITEIVKLRLEWSLKRAKVKTKRKAN